MGGFPPGLVTGPAWKGSTGVCCTPCSCCPPHILKQVWILLETSGGTFSLQGLQSQASSLPSGHQAPFPPSQTMLPLSPSARPQWRWADGRQSGQQSRGTAPRACPLEKSAGPASFPPHLVRVFWCQESPHLEKQTRGCSDGLLGPDPVCRRPGNVCATAPHCPALWEIR